jgi:hypothetical protein
MKKYLFTIAVLALFSISLNSCSQDTPVEELQELEISKQLATQQEESTNGNETKPKPNQVRTDPNENCPPNDTNCNGIPDNQENRN